MIYFALFQCEIVVFPIFGRFRSKIHFSESRDFVMVIGHAGLGHGHGHAGYIQYIIFCLQERDYGSKKEILITPTRFRIFWVASPIFVTVSTIERNCLNVCHLVKTKPWEAILVVIKVT